MNSAILKNFEIHKPNRYKRGLQFLGDTLAGCCNILTVREGQNIIKNKNSLKETYGKLKNVVLQSHAKLLNIYYLQKCIILLQM